MFQQDPPFLLPCNKTLQTPLAQTGFPSSSKPSLLASPHDRSGLSNLMEQWLGVSLTSGRPSHAGRLGGCWSGAWAALAKAGGRGRPGAAHGGAQPGTPGKESPFIINHRQLTSATARCPGCRGPFHNGVRKAAVIIFVPMVPDSPLAL